MRSFHVYYESTLRSEVSKSECQDTPKEERGIRDSKKQSFKYPFPFFRNEGCLVVFILCYWYLVMCVFYVTHTLMYFARSIVSTCASRDGMGHDFSIKFLLIVTR